MNEKQPQPKRRMAGRAARPAKQAPKWLWPAVGAGAAAVLALALLVPWMQRRAEAQAAQRALDALKRKEDVAVEDAAEAEKLRGAYHDFASQHTGTEWGARAEQRLKEFDAELERRKMVALDNEAGGWVSKAREKVRQLVDKGDPGAAALVEKEVPPAWAKAPSVQAFHAELADVRRQAFDADTRAAAGRLLEKDPAGAVTALLRILQYGDDEMRKEGERRLAELRAGQWAADSQEAEEKVKERDFAGATAALARVEQYGDDTQKAEAKKRTVALRGDLLAVPGHGNLHLALEWLARHQGEDGAWQAALFVLECPGSKCAGQGGAEYDLGLTGLTLLAFLNAGHDGRRDDPYRDAVSGKPTSFGKAVQRGLAWLAARQQASGEFTASGVKRPFLSHALATLAVCEAWRRTREPAYQKTAQAALNWLVSVHVPGRGWRYAPSEGKSDTMLTGWALLALSSGKRGGLTFDEKAMADGRHWLDAMTEAKYGRTAYQEVGELGWKVVDGDLGLSRVVGPRGSAISGNLNAEWVHHETLTAQAMVSRLVVDGNKGSIALELGAKLLLQDLPGRDLATHTTDYYHWFFGALALGEFEGSVGEGKLGKLWWKPATEAVLGGQSADGSGCSAGSWSEDERWAHAGGRVYATAMCALTLEALYGYRPFFAD